MFTQAQVHRLHELINDIFINIHDISVCTDSGRDARQKALCNTIAASRLIDDMGLRQDVVDRELSTTNCE